MITIDRDLVVLRAKMIWQTEEFLSRHLAGPSGWNGAGRAPATAVSEPRADLGRPAEVWARLCGWFHRSAVCDDRRSARREGAAWDRFHRLPGVRNVVVPGGIDRE